MSESFTHWWRMNRRRVTDGHLSLDEAFSEARPLRESLQRGLADIAAARLVPESQVCLYAGDDD